jgi:hypothetical protein
MPQVIRIGNAQGFWGDDSAAAARLVAQSADLDVVTLDYLAEVTMSILARQREKDSNLGYARDFVDVARSLAPAWKSARKLKVITNAGGLNPLACAESVVAALRAEGCGGVRIGIVWGDDVLELLKGNPDEAAFRHLETGQPLKAVHDKLVTANAYLGAAPIVEALTRGADIVVTGRVADPSLTVAPCIAHHGWAPGAYDALAGATVAGHLIECGTQVTGGISTDWLNLPRPADIGFPIVEVAADGSCIVTKPPRSGGIVNARTVKEQLLYELGDPANYLSPDCAVSFLTIRVEDLGGDRVRVAGASGRAPSEQYKVSATYRAGFRASGTLTIVGRDAVAKARRAGEVVRQRLRDASLEPQHFLSECIGSGDTAAGVLPRRDDLMETTLRLSASDDRREPIERFSREIVPLVTSGPQGTTGYFEGRPAVRGVFGYWPCLIPRARVQPLVEVIQV